MNDFETTLKARLEDFVRAYNGLNFDDIRRIYHPEAKLLPMGGELIDGQLDAIVAAIKVSHSGGLAKLETTHIEVEMLAPDTSLTYSTWNWYNADGELGGTLKDVNIWKLVDGEWLLYVDIFNSP